MARSKSARKDSEQGGKWEFKGFHNVKPDRELLDTFNSQSESSDSDLSDRIITLGEAGFKVSFSYEEGRDVWHFSVTGKRTKTVVDGYCLVFNHRDAVRALDFGSWYIKQCLDSDNWPIVATEDEFDW